MENLDNNSYIKILSENTENKKETYINFLDATNLKNFAITSDLTMTIGSGLPYINGFSGNVINNIQNVIHNENSNTETINDLPLKWILARERLINNAKRLNNGWKVDWNSPYTLQEGRAYLYSAGCIQFNKFVISETYAVWKQSEDGLIFKTRSLAMQFINENQEDLQIYFSL